MLREMLQAQKDKLSVIPLGCGTGTGQIRADTSVSEVVSGGWREAGAGSRCAVRPERPLHRTGRSADGRRYWWHDNVSAFKATDLCAQKWLKW